MGGFVIVGILMLAFIITGFVIVVTVMKQTEIRVKTYDDEIDNTTGKRRSNF